MSMKRWSWDDAIFGALSDGLFFLLIFLVHFVLSSLHLFYRTPTIITAPRNTKKESKKCLQARDKFFPPYLILKKILARFFTYKITYRYTAQRRWRATTIYHHCCQHLHISNIVQPPGHWRVQQSQTRLPPSARHVRTTVPLPPITLISI